jgi:sugar-specific transcriptional regulator TrmB
MKQNAKLYLNASELSELLGVSLGSSYRIIRKLNEELEQKGFIVISGKLPRRYFEERYYGGIGA